MSGECLQHRYHPQLFASSFIYLFFYLFVCLTRTKHRSCPIQCLFAAFIISFIFKPDTVIIENPKSQFIFKVKSSADHNVKKYLTHVFMLL